MSAGSFAESGEKRRVAHRPNPSSIGLVEQLAYKRQSLSKMVNKISSKKMDKDLKREIPFINCNRALKKVEEPAVISSEEEEEFGDYDEQEEESCDEDWDKKDIKRSLTPPSPPAAANVPSVSSEPTFQERIQTLSDSSDSEPAKPERKWLCKPRLNGKTAEIAANRKRAFIVSSSDEHSDDDTSGKRAVTLKQMVKKAKRRSKQGGVSSEESDAVDSDDNVQLGSDSDSDDSRAGDQQSKKKLAALKELRPRCVAFFNTATREKLLTAPKVTAVVANFVLNNRPFTSFSHLEGILSQCPRGAVIAEQYVDYLENRGILEAILDDCRHHSDHMQTALEALRLDEVPATPKLLDQTHKLHPYQQVGLNWLIMMHKLKLNAILGDEMGLGKTIQVIAFLAHLKEKKERGPHLIVVPSSTIENWMAELAKWAPSINILTYYGSMDDRRQLRAMATDKSLDVLLTTYNMVSSKAEDRKFFKRFKINYVIYDEGHLLKGCHTQRYRSLMKVRGERKILLTGTPLQNNLMELISLMYFTMTKLFTKYCDDISQLLLQFQQRIPAMESKSGALYEADKIETAKAILQPFILRRLKDTVLSCLPKKNEAVVSCDMTNEQQSIYDDLVREFKESEGGGDRMNVGRLMQLRQIANHPLLYRRRYHDERVVKIAKVLCCKENEYNKKNPEHVAEDLAFLSDFAISQLCSKFTSTQHFCLEERIALKSGKFKQLDRLLPDIKHKGDKVLIFSQFTTMMDILEVYMRVRGYEYCRLDGSTPVMERQELINTFNSCDSVFVFLLSTKAGGMGINLTAANHIFLHDIDFNPYNDKQAEDRCHRMGQEKEVFVNRLISKGTVEEGMLFVAQKKLQLERAVTGVDTQQDSESESQLVEQLLKKALSLE